MTVSLQSTATDPSPGFSAQLGEQARAARKAQRLSIRAAAEQLNCSPRFVHELEWGKPTARMDKVLQALEGLGLQLSVSAKPLNHDARVEASTGRIGASAWPGG